MPSLRFLATLFVLSLFVLNVLSTCYRYDGIAHAGDVQCIGSSACCGSTEQCLPNRLCQISPANATSFLLRGTCTYKNWNDPGANCPDVCRYEEQTGVWGIGIEECKDGSFCCDFGNQTCCDRNQGTFLDPTGKAILKSTTSSATSVPTTLKTSSASSSITPTSDAISTAGDSTSSAALKAEAISSGTKIGLGVGIPLGIIALCALGFVIFRQHNRIKALRESNGLGGTSGQSLKYHEMGMQGSGYYTPQVLSDPPAELEYPPQELDSRPNPNVPVAFRK